MSDTDMRRLPFKEGGVVPVRTAISIGILALAFGIALGAIFFPVRNSGATELDGAPLGVDLSPVWKAWRVIDEKFVPAAVSTSTAIATSTEQANEERVWGMIQGLADSLHDPYTFFLPPKENEIFEQDISGAFEGVGMEIAVRDEVLTVVSPLKGTPAEKAGIKSGDKVLKIDGADTSGMDISTAVSHIRGKKGTTVTLLIMRGGFTEPREFNVVRDVINVPIVTTKKEEGGVFVIEVRSFTANSPGLFREALREFVQTGNSRLVLDLRGNPGGYLEASVDMASWFLPSGRVVVTEDYGGNEENVVHRSRGYNIFKDNLKMVILVDKGSASASEILAGALRHYGIAELVGDNTFGKGSVQEVVDITRNTALKLTVARWLDPGGNAIPHDGIKPDVRVEAPETKEGEAPDPNDDPQLDRAIEILRGK
jgi:carboxyl-terminal processing protease